MYSQETWKYRLLTVFIRVYLKKKIVAVYIDWGFYFSIMCYWCRKSVNFIIHFHQTKYKVKGRSQQRPIPVHRVSQCDRNTQPWVVPHTLWHPTRQCYDHVLQQVKMFLWKLNAKTKNSCILPTPTELKQEPVVTDVNSCYNYLLPKN